MVEGVVPPRGIKIEGLRGRLGGGSVRLSCVEIKGNIGEEGWSLLMASRCGGGRSIPPSRIEIEGDEVEVGSLH